MTEPDLDALRRHAEVMAIGPNTGSHSQRVAYFHAAAMVQLLLPDIVAALERIPELERSRNEWKEMSGRWEVRASSASSLYETAVRERDDLCARCERQMEQLARAQLVEEGIAGIIDGWWAKWSSHAGPPTAIKNDLLERIRAALAASPVEESGLRLPERDTNAGDRLNAETWPPAEEGGRG